MYRCEICLTPVSDYEPEYCCSGYMCGCFGKPIEPCVCSERCYKALMDGIGKPMAQRAKDAEIAREFEDIV